MRRPDPDNAEIPRLPRHEHFAQPGLTPGRFDQVFSQRKESSDGLHPSTLDPNRLAPDLAIDPLHHLARIRARGSDLVVGAPRRHFNPTQWLRGVRDRNVDGHHSLSELTETAIKGLHGEPVRTRAFMPHPVGSPLEVEKEPVVGGVATGVKARPGGAGKPVDWRYELGTNSPFV